MQLVTARLVDFRNVTADIEFGPGLNVFTGRNGQGKTNVLESVFAVANGKSFRPGRLVDMVRFDAAYCRVDLQVESAGVITPVSMTIAGKERRHTVGGNENCTLVEVGTALRVIFFGPEDLDLLKGGPGARRAFIDQALVGHHPPYGELLKAYGKLLRERTLLLRETGYARPPPFELIESYEQELARKGAQILSARLKYLREFNPVAERLTGLHSDGRLPVTLRYKSSFEPAQRAGDPPEADELTAPLYQHFAKTRMADAECGRTTTGPHVDDLDILLRGRSARFFASQGEQRQLAVSLKIAQLAVWKERFSVCPVLLLDDVLSELDGERSGLLMSGIREWQVQTLISTTVAPDMVSKEPVRFFHVRDGMIVQE